jgi:hypothetical protein
MGQVGTRFGRNVPLDRVYPEAEPGLMTPSPRLVSRELLTRDVFAPATSLNLLAAAWLQFMLHDWFSHGKNEPENPWRVPLPPGDDWFESPMRVLRTRRDPTHTAGDGLPPTYLNTATHWWDGSQLYGSGADTLAKLRQFEDGRLIVGPDGLLPVEPESGVDMTGVNGNWWVGLSLMHTLFTLEHNAICRRLRAAYPAWDDDELFEHARLVNAALMAKIHTVEWTPAIISHPTTRFAMRGNWWGLLQEPGYRLLGRFSGSEVISGIPGSPTDHHTAPYAMTEEFVAVYRMHPLMPDDYRVLSAADGRLLRELPLPDVLGRAARKLVEEVPMVDLLYSAGVAHPGAVTLHNYPRFLQRRPEKDGVVNDLATIDVLRDRERGVPRYNQFRRLFHRRAVSGFADLTDNPAWAEQIRRVYDDDIERVDLMVGLYAEPRPRGFGFSDTAFRVFALMASRRLKSDRFFTRDYTPQVYSPAGLEWVDENTMTTVLLRHFPGLAPALRSVENAFAPWPKEPSPSPSPRPEGTRRGKGASAPRRR